MVIITFILVLIFRKTNDSTDEEYDHEDDGSPIYLDAKIGSFQNLAELEVNFKSV